MSTAQLAQRVASEVRAELGRQRRSVYQAATDLGIPYTVLLRRVQGNVPFNVNELGQIAEYLGRTPAEIISTSEATLVTGGAA